ncbi:MAG: hypothetical protein FWG14_05445 [Peptococcaceae bacterium]|nr:hypothetical protein [Peptococcaceae bacterium]
MLTQERADILTKILSADEERAKVLLSLEADEALKQINALGNDFTLDELSEYGKALKAVSAQGDELDVESLDDVVGGLAIRDIFSGIGDLLGKFGSKVLGAVNWIGNLKIPGTK